MDIPKDLKYDGVYFLPHEQDGNEGLKYQFFELKEEDLDEPIESSSLGNKYHLVFFKEGDDGLPVLEDQFEAILVDPATYLHGLLGAGVYGCILRKTAKSQDWIDNYLDGVLKSVLKKKLLNYAESIVEN